MTLQGKIESLLFVVGDEGLTLDELAYLCEDNTATIYRMIEQMNERYTSETHSSFYIMETGHRFTLVTKKEYAPLLQKYAQSPMSNKLSQASLETLAIIAYKQPVTRAEIDEIRGVQSSGALQNLVTRHLIKEVGRVEGPGRPILYGVTDYFMNYFGLEQLSELPSISEMEAELSEMTTEDLFFQSSVEEIIEEETGLMEGEI
ncbi:MULTISPECIES: SMC-Scp complex subunit ScpB [Vagococcus]|uniref:Segregation and condensation protein B n=1 Tax=Vagococcus lutrae TaxID=81947 RepID=A0AAE9XHJ8_9ENTE|nr:MULTISPECIES: SMC-Scp complex subunit ScpB [Vagococcus]MCO7151471.1 SMC-Scp complex subunit ScpB [Vagococcus lutrae]MDO5742448.1 SMC-Scp complex subunit ScpB [Vagococcus sp.]MDT2801039.1 SMC-Scp complex subunit ScpB [Vagococcus lutrae]MDT2812275.1 SMC-Scp complex subunit ScpB [Vagococcus lutrae]MDT2817457.1 SMC-Scp complex subunit ScpB [Vagococcus lutrae]